MRHGSRQAGDPDVAPAHGLAGRAAAVAGVHAPTSPASCSCSACSPTAGWRCSSAPSTGPWACAPTAGSSICRRCTSSGASTTCWSRARRTRATTGSTCRSSPGPPAISTCTTSRCWPTAGWCSSTRCSPAWPTPSIGHSFAPLWQPPFVSRLAAEDRCHLNGLALRDGRPAFVTAVSRSDVADGWRERRRDGGVVVDVASGEIVARRPVDAAQPALAGVAGSTGRRGGRLWLLDSGNGRFGYLDAGSGRFEPVAFCPGYARGLAFARRLRRGRPVAAARQPDLQPAWRSTTRWRHATPSRAAACWSSTCAPATRCTGCGSKAWSRSCTTWRCCPACAGRWRWG